MHYAGKGANVKNYTLYDSDHMTSQNGQNHGDSEKAGIHTIPLPSRQLHFSKCLLKATWHCKGVILTADVSAPRGCVSHRTPPCQMVAWPFVALRKGLTCLHHTVCSLWIILC